MTSVTLTFTIGVLILFQGHCSFSSNLKQGFKEVKTIWLHSIFWPCPFLWLHYFLFYIKLSFKDKFHFFPYQIKLTEIQLLIIFFPWPSLWFWLGSSLLCIYLSRKEAGQESIPLQSFFLQMVIHSWNYLGLFWYYLMLEGYRKQSREKL